MARPMSLRPTESRCWRLYTEDVEKCLNSGKAPKDIFALGVMALEKGWSGHKDDKEIQNVDLRVSKLSNMLELYIHKFNDLNAIIENKLKIDVGANPANIDLLKKKLTELEELEAKLAIKKKAIKK